MLGEVTRHGAHTELPIEAWRVLFTHL